MVQAPCRPSKIKPKWDQSIQKITHPSGRPGVWQGNLKRGIYAPRNWTSPPLLPRTPNHFGRQNAAFFTFEFFLIGLVRIIFGPADRRGRGCDGRWRGLIFLLVIAFHYLQSSSSCSGWWSFEISGFPSKMIGSRRLFLPRSLGHIQLCSHVKRSFKCTVNPLMFELQGSKIWTIWPKWQPGTIWFGAFSKWKQVDWLLIWCVCESQIWGEQHKHILAHWLSCW